MKILSTPARTLGKFFLKTSLLCSLLYVGFVYYIAKPVSQKPRPLIQKKGSESDIIVAFEEAKDGNLEKAILLVESFDKAGLDKIDVPLLTRGDAVSMVKTFALEKAKMILRGGGISCIDEALAVLSYAGMSKDEPSIKDLFVSAGAVVSDLEKQKFLVALRLLRDEKDPSVYVTAFLYVESNVLAGATLDDLLEWRLKACAFQAKKALQKARLQNDVRAFQSAVGFIHEGMLEGGIFREVRAHTNEIALVLARRRIADIKSGKEGDLEEYRTWEQHYSALSGEVKQLSVDSFFESAALSSE